MSNRKCDFCGHEFKEGQLVEAKLIAPYRVIPSKKFFAIEKPQDCTGVRCYPTCFEQKNGD